METFFTPSMIFLLAGIGFVGIVALHLIILLVHKISKHKEYSLQQQRQQVPTSECNVSVRGGGGECNLAESRETLGSNNAMVMSNKCGTLKSTATVHSSAEPKTNLNTKLEKLEYPRGDIVYVRSLGQGAFGRVFQVV